jgi:hypothetical protein
VLKNFIRKNNNKNKNYDNIDSNSNSNNDNTSKPSAQHRAPLSALAQSLQRHLHMDHLQT